MNLTLAQKSELDALVNFFGGSDNILASYKSDPTHRALRRRGLIRRARRDKPFSAEFAKLIATKKGIAVAKRFKRDWSQVWADLHPREPE